MRIWTVVMPAAMAFAVAMTSDVVADDQIANFPYLAAAAHDPNIRGSCYVIAWPDDDDPDDQTGVTRVFRPVEFPADTVRLDMPEVSYDWYSHTVFADCDFSRQGEPGISVVRFGPWPRGGHANERQLAIAFYFNDDLLARYSTLDIAGSPDNVDQSAYHYVVFRRVLGWRDGNRSFAVETVDGRVLSFDLATGRLIKRGIESAP